MFWRKWSFAIAVAVLLCLAGVGLVAFGVYRDMHKYDHLSLAQIQRWTGVPFPPSAEIVLHDDNHNIRVHQIRAKIVMTRKDAVLLAARVREHARRLESGMRISSEWDLNMSSLGSYPPLPEWWLPGFVKKFLAVESPGNKSFMLIGLDEGSTSTVYFFFSSS